MKKVGAALAVAAVTATTVAGGAQAKSSIIDSVTLKAKPSGDKVQIAAIEGPAERIEITLSVKKGSKYKLLAKDRVNGADIDDGKIEITAKRKGDDAGKGELTIGRDYAEGFTWSLDTRKIGFDS